MKARLAVMAVLVAVVMASVCSMQAFNEQAARQQEEFRTTRAKLQKRRQQITVLQTPGMADRMARLDQTLDTLRIRVVEVLTREPWPSAVQTVDYTLAMRPDTLSPDESESMMSSNPVRVLRLELHLTVRNAIAYLSMLERIDSATGIWPHETRGCEIQMNHDRELLDVQCVMDIYHWQTANARPSAVPGNESGLA